MAKKRSTTRQTHKQTTIRPDSSAEIEQAEERLRQAREILREAECAYAEAQKSSSAESQPEAEHSVGELVDGTLELVKKYPGPSVITAAVVGFLLGRIFPRF